jgi:membrane protein
MDTLFHRYMIFLKRIGGFYWFVLQRFLQQRCTETAASLSYTSLLSLVPLMAVIFAGFSSFSVFQELFEELQRFVFDNFVPSSSEVIKQYLETFVGKASKLTLFGLLGLFIIAILLVWQIDRALNQIWGITKSKRLMHTFLTYWAVLTLGPVFIGISLMVTSYITSLPLITDAADSIGYRTEMLSMVPVVLTLIVFTMVYQIVPNTHVPLFHALIGGLTATILFELAKRGFALYISKNTTYASLYGALATVPIFLIWIYISWLVTLLGAMTTRLMTLYDFSMSEQASSSHPFQSAFHIMRLLSSSAEEGLAISDSKLHNDAFLCHEKNLDGLLYQLEQSGWILKTENEFWAQARDLNNVTVWDFYHALPYSLPKNLSTDPLSELISNTNGVLKTQLDVPMKSVFSRYSE